MLVPSRVVVPVAVAFALGAVVSSEPRQHAAGGGTLSSWRGPYMGAPKPSGAPMVFVEDFFSAIGRVHAAPSFAPALDEVVWSAHVEASNLMAILTSHATAGVWGPPQVAVFSGTHWDDDPVFSPDGRHVAFISRRPCPAAPEARPGAFHVWTVARAAGTWGAPRCLGMGGGSPSVTATGRIYLADSGADSLGDLDLYVHEPEGSGRKRLHLGAPVNSPFSEFTPFVSPDERWLLYSANHRPEGNGLFLSRGDGAGGWGAPVFLSGVLGVDTFARYPRLSPDGAFLFFVAEGRVFWWRFSPPARH